MSLSSIARSALAAQSAKLDHTARNLARLGDDAARPLRTEFVALADGGVTARATSGAPGDRVDLTEEVVALMEAERGFSAGVKLIRTEEETLRSLLDVQG